MRIDLMQPSRGLRQVMSGLLLVCLIGLQGVVAHHAVAHAFEGASMAPAQLVPAHPVGTIAAAGDDHAPDDPVLAHGLCALCTLATHLADALPGMAPVMADADAAAILRAGAGFSGAERSALTPQNRGPPRA